VYIWLNPTFTMSKKIFTPEQENIISLKYSSGDGVAKIAKEMGYPFYLILNTLKRLKIYKQKYKHIDKKIYELIIKDNESGIGTKMLFKKYKVYPDTISNFFRKNNIPLIREKKDIGTNIKYSIDFEYFNNINTPQKAYWLGWLWADGCIHKTNYSISISLQEKDGQILERLKKHIKAENPILIKESIGKKGQTLKYNTFTIRSKRIFNNLLLVGMTPKKSLTVAWPKDLKDDLVKYFIRGYFEGDGCIFHKKYKTKRGIASQYNASLACSDIFAQIIKDYLSKIGIESNIQKTGKISILNIGKLDSLVKFSKLIYSDHLEEMTLERKFLKIKSSEEYYQNQLNDPLSYRYK